MILGRSGRAVQLFPLPAAGRSVLVVLACSLAVLGGRAAGGVVYQIDDGTAERVVVYGPAEDTIWLNTFPVQPGGERITSILAAFGRPGIVSLLNGLPVTAVLYEDADGGSPQNAVLRASADGVIGLANTNQFTEFEIAPTTVQGPIAVGIIFRNTTPIAQLIAPLDLTSPVLEGRSYTGFTFEGLDEQDLSGIPAGQFGAIEALGTAGNFLVRARGTPIPEAGCATGAGFICIGTLARRRSRGCKPPRHRICSG